MKQAKPLGAFVDGEATTFRLWSSHHIHCEVRLFDDAGATLSTIALAASGDGVFEASVLRVGHGARYRFVLDGTEVNDPYARFLPDGISGPAMVWDARHVWRHAPVTRPLREHVIYELHIGTFTDDGTYTSAIGRLRDLLDLGVTALELLPVATYSGHHGWGYDGVAHYAPHAAYGTPDELRAFVDAAHGHGLAVFLDVVYNHFGPSGNVLGQYSAEYFTHDIQTTWGDAPNLKNRWMRRFMGDNVMSWLVDFQFDGLRFDAVHQIVDPTDRHILREISDLARTLDRHVLLVAEDDRNDPGIVETLGYDAVWADDFHHAVHVTITRERDGYYDCYEPGLRSIADAIQRGWLYEGQPFPTNGTSRGRPAGTLPAEAFIYCLQNHDQVGNRATGDRLSSPVGVDAYCAASALLLFLPMTPLLFMGQEWAATSPFLYFTDHDPKLGNLVSAGRREEFKKFRAFSDPAVRETIPDPQAVATFERSRLRWDERAKPQHARVLALYRAMLALRRQDPVLVAANRNALAADVRSELLVVRRWAADEARTLIVNFGASPRELPVRGRMLLHTHETAPPDLVPPASAVILATTS